MSWDGKIYDKYRIEHTDGTPLKGKKYFVLRLDSDDPVEAARVAAAMRAYKNEPRNRDRSATEEVSTEANTMKAMREALVTIRRRLVAPYESEARFMRYSPNRPLVDLIDAALAEPPRQCDVGTPDEQAKRFDDFCVAQCQKSCTSCPVYKEMTTGTECFARWAQMPYEAKEGGEE